MSSLASNEESINQGGNLIDGSYEEIQQKWLMHLQEFQQLQSNLIKSQCEVANLERKLHYARKSLEEEKRNRRVLEKKIDLQESQINMAREILFHNEETNLDEEIKKKLQFLNILIIKNKQNPSSNNNNRNIQNDRYPNTIEMNSTGSILSDLNCLSKSEEDFDMNIVSLIQNQKQQKWKEHKPSDECFINKQHNTLDKVAKFNSLDKVITTTVKSNKGTHTASRTQVASSNENTNSIEANHSFISKIVIKPEMCISCGKRIRFGKTILKCRKCPFMCHVECKTIIFNQGKIMLCCPATK